MVSLGIDFLHKMPIIGISKAKKAKLPSEET